MTRRFPSIFINCLSLWNRVGVQVAEVDFYALYMNLCYRKETGLLDKTGPFDSILLSVVSECLWLLVIFWSFHPLTIIWHFTKYFCFLFLQLISWFLQKLLSFLHVLQKHRLSLLQMSEDRLKCQNEINNWRPIKCDADVPDDDVPLAVMREMCKTPNPTDLSDPIGGVSHPILESTVLGQVRTKDSFRLLAVNWT